MKGKKKEFNEAFFKRLGERLRELRIDAGYESAEYFAHEVGVSRSQYGNYENGTSDMRMSNLLKIAEGLSITIDELLKGLH